MWMSVRILPFTRVHPMLCAKIPLVLTHVNAKMATKEMEKLALVCGDCVFIAVVVVVVGGGGGGYFRNPVLTSFLNIVYFI